MRGRLCKPDRRPHRRRARLAALLAVTGSTPAHPHWITPDDLWRDWLAILADQGAWLTSWGPRPGEPDCRVPLALLPESQTQRENSYFLWRSAMRTSVDKASESRTVRQPRSRRRDDTEQTARPRPGGANRPGSNPTACWIKQQRR
jgi:hypothetical protein